tara:strand:+ start:411 stop:722 length:312 start_codon:yes stop_codon:yes gene_type:complete
MAARVKLEQQLQDGAAATDVVVLDQSTVGRVSRVDAMQQQSMAVSTLASAQASLREVITALRHIDEERYGYCSNCDEPIEFKRLRVQPQASHCLNCQDQLDQA